MAIEEKSSIDTLLIAAEVLERNLVKNFQFQSKEHLFQRDSLIRNAQRRFSAACATPVTSNVLLHSSSDSPSTPSKRHWLTSDLIVSRAAVPIQCSSSANSLSDFKTVLSPRSRSSSGSSNNNNGSASLVLSSNPESPESWQVQSSTSPTEAPISYTPIVTTPTDASSSFPHSISDSTNIIPLRQLRTALLGERLVGGVKIQRCFSTTNPPSSQFDLISQAADLVNLAPESAVTSFEKAAPRLPAKKRKFDWDERSSGDSTLATAPIPSPLPASLIVDKPAQLNVANTRRSSVSPFPKLSATTATFHYPSTQRVLSKLDVSMQQRKFSYPNLSSNSNIASSVASLRPPPIAAFSARTDVLPRHSSLVAAAHSINSSSIGNGTSKSTSTSSSSSPTAKSISRVWSPPSIPKSDGSSSGGSRKADFPFMASSASSAVPPRQCWSTHHSEAGRRYSVFETPNLASTLAMQHTSATRRHISMVSTGLPTIPSSFATTFGAAISPQRQQYVQSYHEAKPLSPPISLREEGRVFGGSDGGHAGTRPLSAPEEPVPLTWSSPCKADRPPTRFSASPRNLPPTETRTTTSKERQRRIGHVSVLGSILSSYSSTANTFVTPTPEIYSQPPTCGPGEREGSAAGIPVAKTRNYSGASSVSCRPRDKSFDGCFPLLLVSAPTSASAAEFAAATAVASGATASSLIPVPVQIVPSSVSASISSSSLATSGEAGVALISKTTNEADQRLVFPLMSVSTPDGQMSGCTLGIPLLVPSRQHHCHSPPA